MSSAIADLEQPQLRGGLLEAIRTWVGGNVSNDAVRRAFDEALPTSMFAIADQGSSERGARTLLEGLREGKYPQTDMHALGRTLSDPEESEHLLKKSGGTLETLFGGKLNGVVDAIGEFAGIGRGGSSKILAVAAPIALGLIGRRVRDDNLDAGGLSELLSDQKSKFETMLPAPLRGVLGVGAPAAAQAASASSSTAGTIPSKGRESKSRAWVEKSREKGHAWAEKGREKGHEWAERGREWNESVKQKWDEKVKEPVRHEAKRMRADMADSGTSIWPWLLVALAGLFGLGLLYRACSTSSMEKTPAVTAPVTQHDPSMPPHARSAQPQPQGQPPMPPTHPMQPPSSTPPQPGHPSTPGMVPPMPSGEQPEGKTTKPESGAGVPPSGDAHEGMPADPSKDKQEGMPAESAKVELKSGSKGVEQLSKTLEGEGSKSEEIELDGLSYAADSTELTAEGKRIGDDLATLLEKNPGAKIRIEGHTDATGTVVVNKRVSQERADALKRYVVMKGIDEGRIVAVGVGTAKPSASNDTPADRAQNRRTTVVVL